jgi:hypothetical protein
MIETIAEDGQVLAYLIRAAGVPKQTTFLTPAECSMQVGYVVYPAGGEIPRHVHLPVERNIVGTPEVLVVQQGSCEVDVYTNDRRLVAVRRLATGDIIVALDGGHGFRAQEDLVLLEIKQGPFQGDEATKERF